MYKEEQTKQVATVESNVEKEPKKKINKKIILGATCATIVLLGVVSAVALTKSKKVEEITDESELLVTEKDTYEGLNYTQNKEEIEKKSFFYDLDRNLEGSKIDVSYISVSGLKDKSLEEKINETLKEAAQKMYDGTSLGNSQVLYDHVYNYTDVYIFNNVLSTMYCREFCDIEGNISYEYSSVNLNLKDYDEFGFKDIFVNTANLDEILPENENVTFSISPKNIYVVNKEKVDKINLYKNIDKVAIYKRFANNKKLFNKTYSAKPYVYTTRRFYETDNYGLVESNLFVDTYNTFAIKENEEYSKEVLDALDSLYKESLNKAKNVSYSNPSKRYIIQLVPKVEKQDDKYYKLNVIFTSFEINKEFFNENVEKFVVASENKSQEEYTQVQYFNNPVMDGQDYLVKTNSDMLEKIVDENGKEKETLVNNQTTNTDKKDKKDKEVEETPGLS